jgi:NADH-quinone oxidoreductase subunit M
VTPISLAERVGAFLLIAASVVVGLYPQVLLRLIAPALDSPLFDGLRRAGGWQ